MALNLALNVALPSLQICDKLLDKIDHRNLYTALNTFWNLSSHTEDIENISYCVKAIEHVSKRKINVELDPEELEYHDKLGDIFKKTINETSPIFLDLMKNNCVQMMVQHLRSQLWTATKVITPYTTTRFFLDPAIVPRISKKNTPASSPSPACQFKETAGKCAKLIEQLDVMGKREELRALNEPFQEILSDIDQFRNEHSITFRTRLKSQDIVYYDRLLGIYFKNSHSQFRTNQEQREEEFAVQSIKDHLVSELNGVIKLCDHYQPQLEMELAKESQSTHLLLLDE